MTPRRAMTTLAFVLCGVIVVPLGDSRVLPLIDIVIVTNFPDRVLYADLANSLSDCPLVNPRQANEDYVNAACTRPCEVVGITEFPKQQGSINGFGYELRLR